MLAVFAQAQYLSCGARSSLEGMFTSRSLPLVLPGWSMLSSQNDVDIG